MVAVSTSLYNTVAYYKYIIPLGYIFKHNFVYNQHIGLINLLKSSEAFSKSYSRKVFTFCCLEES